MFPTTTYHAHALLPLLLETNGSFGLQLMETRTGSYPNVHGYMSLPYLTPQPHAEAIPGIKLAYLENFLIFVSY
jgi:hypothetical protein